VGEDSTIGGGEMRVGMVGRPCQGLVCGMRQKEEVLGGGGGKVRAK